MSYRSPVGDILFSLKAVAGLPEMIGSELDADCDWDTVSSVVAEAGRFATDEIAPLNRPGDIVGARYENGIVAMPPGFGDVYRRWARPAGAASRRRPNSAAWACRIRSTSPAPKSGTGRRWRLLSARC